MEARDGNYISRRSRRPVANLKKKEEADHVKVLNSLIGKGRAGSDSRSHFAEWPTTSALFWD